MSVLPSWEHALRTTSVAVLCLSLAVPAALESRVRDDAPSSPTGAPSRPPAQSSGPFDATALIDAYAAGDDARVAGALQRRGAIVALREGLERLDFEAGDGAARRFVAAALAVEAAQYRGFEERDAAVEIIESACRMLRRHDTATEQERLWYRASLTILAGLARGSDLEVHALHALARFRNEPRFELALAVASELRTFPDPRARERLSHRLGESAFEVLVTRLHRAAVHAPVRAEALVRLAFVHLRDGNPDRALEQLEEVPDLTTEPFLLYLAHLFHGRALERTDRLGPAIAAYRAAMAAVPGAQSAHLALASALLRHGDLREADAEARRAVSIARAPDPWSGYGQGDLRLWLTIREQLRKAVR